LPKNCVLITFLNIGFFLRLILLRIIQNLARINNELKKPKASKSNIPGYIRGNILSKSLTTAWSNQNALNVRVSSVLRLSYQQSPFFNRIFFNTSGVGMVSRSLAMDVTMDIGIRRLRRPVRESDQNPEWLQFPSLSMWEKYGTF
jgi:hypothetical protein